MPDRSSDISDPSPQPSTAAPSRLRRWGRRLAQAVGVTLGTVLLVLGPLLVALQTTPGATVAAQWLASTVNPFPNTTLTVSSASGTWLHSLRLTEVTLTRTDGVGAPASPMAHVDTIDVRYRLLALLRGRIDVTTLTLDGPEVTMRQSADSTWDWGRLLSSPEEADPESDPVTEGGPPIRVGTLHLEEGAFSAEYYSQSGDSATRIRDVRLQARNVEYASPVTAQLDTLGLRGRLPGDTTDLTLAATGALASDAVALDTLLLDSPRSRVRGHGRVRLPTGPGDSVEDVGLHLQAQPLALRDLTLFAPTLDVDPRETVHADARVTGSGQRLSVTADAEFSTGGRITTEAAFTPTTETTSEGPLLEYQVNAQIRDLTTSLLGPAIPAENRITADLTANLQGRSIQELDGTADLRVRNTRWTRFRTPTLTLTSTLRNGAARVQVGGLVNDARLSADGTITPFASRPSLDLSGRARNVDLRAFAPDLGIDGRLIARTEVQGRALGTEDQDLEIDVRLDSSRVGVQPIDVGELSLRLRSAEAQLNGRLTLPGGSVAAEAAAALDGSERFSVRELTLKNVSVPAFTGDTTSSHVTGTAQLDGRGFAPATAVLEGSLELVEGAYGPHSLRDVAITASLRQGRLTAGLDGIVDGGMWSLAGTGRPFAQTPEFELTEGRFRNLDIAPFVGQSARASRLHGTVDGRVRGLTPSTMQATLDVTLDSSQVHEQTIPSAGITVRLQDAVVEARGRLKTPDGGAQFAGRARPFDEVPRYEISEGTYESIHLGALMNRPALSTSLSGRFSLEGQGATPDQLRLAASLDVTDSRINRADVPSGRIAVRADRGEATMDGSLSVGDGRVQVTGQLDSIDATPRYNLSLTASSIDAAALAGRDTLTARLGRLQWSLEGRGTSLADLDGSTHLAAGRMQINRLKVDTTMMAADLRRGRLNVDTLLVQGNAFTSRGRGMLALTDTAAASDFSLHTSITDARPLRSVLNDSTFQVKQADIKTNVYGSSLSAQRFDGRATVKSLKYGDLQLTEAELTFNGRRGQEQFLQRLEVDGALGYLSVPSLSVERTEVQATYDGQHVELSSRVRIDPTHSGRLEASITPTDSVTTATLTTLNLQMGRDQWSLLQDATIIASDHYRVRGLLLYSEDQQIAADGIVDFEGRQSLVVTVEGVRLGAVSPLFGLSGLDGRISGSIDLTGRAAAPVLDTRLALDLESEEQPVGTLRFDATYEELAVELDAELTHTDGSELTATGTIPTDLRLDAQAPVDVESAPVRLDLRTTRFPVNWVDPFLDPASVRNVKGILTADVTVRGTRDTPELSGMASLTGGGASFPALRTRYRRAGATLRFANDQVTLEDAVVRSTNNGRLRAEGTINFPALTVGEYDLTLKASDFIAIDTRAYRRAIVDGNMTLRGTTTRPELAGSVELKSADIYFNEALAESDAGVEMVPLTSNDQLTLENRFGIRLSESDTTAFDVYQALAMDLTVQIQRNTWLRSRSTPEMNIQFTGDLDLTKAHNREPEVFGSIQVLTERSTLRQFGQEFRITEGSLTFNGDPFAPFLNLAAVYEQRAWDTQGTEVEITLRLEGQPDELSPTLSSDPPMDTRNILSYLATGRPASEIGSGSGNIATQVALGQASNFVENLAASELGLDVVRVQLQASGTSYLTVGRYFTPRLFVSVEQPVTTSNLGSTQSQQYLPDLTVEYQLLDTLLLRALNNQQSLQLNLLFEYAY